MIEKIVRLLVRYRQDCRTRFNGRFDWVRISLLGIYIGTFSAIALTDALLPIPLPGHFGGGGASLFAGVMTALIIIKLSKGTIYLDWVAFALSSIAVGTVLYVDELILDVMSLALILVFLALSSATRLLIGMTASPRKAATCIFLSGLITALAGVYIVGVWTMGLSVLPQTIIALDCLFQGLSVATFGLSLRDAS